MLKSSLDEGILEINGLPDAPMLLIISAPTYLTNPDLLNYVAWKSSKGFRPRLVTTDTTGTTTTAIKAYIQNAYTNWAIPPTYVLLIGDSPTIPAWTGSGEGNPKTDLNYSLLAEKELIRGSCDDDDYGWVLGGVQSVLNEVEAEIGKLKQKA